MFFNAASSEIDVQPPDEGVSVPRGRRWLDELALPSNRLKRLLSKVERSKEELKPYKGGVIGDFARLLCCRDENTVKNLFGLGAVRHIPPERIESVASDKLARGNKGCFGRINTNKSYWPRQLEFLEFVQGTDLMSSLEDVATESGRTQEELSALCNWRSGKISLVSPKAAIAYLEAKRSSRECKDLTADDITTFGNVDEMFLDASSSEGRSMRRRNKPVKEHLSEIDSVKYEGALNELRKVQLFLIGIEGMMKEQLGGFYGFEALMTDIARQHKQLELRNCSDKAHDGLHTLPSKQDLENLYSSWWNKASMGRLQGHTGLMNFCSFLDMRATLARGDNAIMQSYCDKVLIVASDFSDHVSLKTPVPLQLYVTLAREGKPNKNNVKDYFVKLPGKDPNYCSVVMESALLTLRHDVLGVPVPCFSDVRVNRARQTIERKWYEAKFYCALSSNGKSNGRSSDIGSGIDSKGLYTPYKMDSMYRSWSRDFTEHEISSLHVVHLPRVLETFLLSLHGCSREETGVLGKWRVYSDSQSLSYEKIPDTNLLAKVSGYSDLASYRPYWITMDVPATMVAQVLKCFDGELERAIERCRRSRLLRDPFEAKIQDDGAAVQCLKYIESLRRVFILAAPFLRASHGSHPLFQEHGLFGHPLWSRWENLQLKHCHIMELIDVDLNNCGQGSTQFGVIVEDDNWTIVSKPTNPMDRRFEAHAKRLTSFINGETNLPITINETTQQNLTDKDSRDVLIESLQTKVTTLEKAFLHQEQRHCLIESKLLSSERVPTTSSQSSHLMTPAPLTREMQSPTKPKKRRKGNKTRPSELKSLPPLSVLNNLPISIEHIRNMWNNEWTHGSWKNRPLKDIVSSKHPNKNHTSNRALANQLKRIRYLMIAVDILEYEGVVDATSKLSSMLKHRAIHLNKGADQIVGELSRYGIVQPGKKITTDIVLKSSAYQQHRLRFLWSELIK